MNIVTLLSLDNLAEIIKIFDLTNTLVYLIVNEEYIQIEHIHALN